MNLKVAVVEDDNFMRAILSKSLDEDGVDIAFTASTATEAVTLAKETLIHVALLDLHLGKGPNGIDLANQLRKLYPKIGIVFLTSFDDPRLLAPGSEIPKDAVYLVKKNVTDLALLTKTLYQAALGRPSKTDDDALFAKFTDTQIETIRLVALGYSNAEIAKLRHITPGSVENSVARLAKSLGLDKDIAKNQRVHIAKVFFKSVGSGYLEQS